MQVCFGANNFFHGSAYYCDGTLPKILLPRKFVSYRPASMEANHAVSLDFHGS